MARVRIAAPPLLRPPDPEEYDNDEDEKASEAPTGTEVTRKPDDTAPSIVPPAESFTLPSEGPFTSSELRNRRLDLAAVQAPVRPGAGGMNDLTPGRQPQTAAGAEGLDEVKTR